jgi:phosphoribosylanthranilate isomerase
MRVDFFPGPRETMANEPLPKYDTLTAAQIGEKLRKADRNAARAVAVHEQEQDEPRSTVIEAAQRRILQLEQEEAAQAAEASANSPVFTVERLRREGDVVLGVALGDVAGSFADVDDSHEVTLVDAQRRVQEWRAREVHIEPTPQDAATL